MSYVGNYGMTSYGSQHLNSVDYCGTLSMDGTQVSGHTKVMGMFTCSNGKLNTVEVNGTMKAVNSEVAGSTSVKGYLEAIGSIFKSGLDLQSKSLTLTDCKTKNITLQTNPDTTQQVVTLIGATQVDGDIRFLNGNGRVNVASTASISGNVVGGIRSNL